MHEYGTQAPPESAAAGFSFWSCLVEARKVEGVAGFGVHSLSKRVYVLCAIARQRLHAWYATFVGIQSAESGHHGSVNALDEAPACCAALVRLI